MNKTIMMIYVALFTASTAALLLTRNINAQLIIPKSGSARKQPPAQFEYPPKATLYRFEVIPGKEEKFAEWMKFLKDNRAAAVQTLEREKTYFESVYTERIDNKTYVFWLEFKGEGGEPVGDSPFELDKKHLEYWNECIKKGSGKTFQTEFYLTPEFLDKTIAYHQKTEK